MTRRERLERKIERRHEWAETRKRKANAVLASHEPFRHDIAFNTQPGHIPFRARIIAQEDRAFESLQVADHHKSKAAGLEQQLDKTIFSDDSDATEALEIRIKNNETKRDHMKEINRLYRKGDAASLAGYGMDLAQLHEKLKTAYSWCQQPYPAYELSNLGQRISGDKKRLEFIKKQQETHAQAEAAPNGVILKQYGEWCSVTFAEKPDRSILDVLRAASFQWGAGSWSGKLASLPTEVKSLLEAPTVNEHTERTQCIKRALKRDPTMPIGFPAPLHLDCICGARVDMPEVKGLPIDAYVCGTCGREYDPQGWLTKEAQPCQGA